MAEKIAVPTKECLGVDVEEHGVVVGSYDAKDGFVEVENKAHAMQIKQRVGAGGKLFGFSNLGNPKAALTKTCACGREWFAWQTICTNCGRDFE